jgi:accessory gene regulator protein AgrB
VLKTNFSVFVLITYCTFIYPINQVILIGFSIIISMTLIDFFNNEKGPGPFSRV